MNVSVTRGYSPVIYASLKPTMAPKPSRKFQVGGKNIILASRWETQLRPHFSDLGETFRWVFALFDGRRSEIHAVPVAVRAAQRAGIYLLPRRGLAHDCIYLRSVLIHSTLFLLPSIFI